MVREVGASACGRASWPDARPWHDGGVRWDQLFEDLEAQLSSAGVAERAAEVAEHTRAERGQVHLVQRFVAGLGATMRLRLVGVGWAQLVLEDVGSDWLTGRTLGARPGRGADLLVPMAAVSAVEGLTARVDAAEGAASRRFDLRYALRAVSRDRALVRVHDTEGEDFTGTVDRVLADHLDLTRRADIDDVRSRGRPVFSLPYTRMACLRRL